MADSKIQKQVEKWIREQWLPTQFRCTFRETNVKLVPGGSFKFDAVSDDDKIVALISTSRSRTSTGNKARGQINKLRADILFLTMLSKKKERVLIFSERDLYEEIEREQKNARRLPKGIKLMHVVLPEKLDFKLAIARERASKEMSSSKRKPKTTR